jgi:hypothetical protein
MRPSNLRNACGGALTSWRRNSQTLGRQSRRPRSPPSSPCPPWPEELKEALFRVDYEKVLATAQGFLDQGQQMRDELVDE